MQQFYVVAFILILPFFIYSSIIIVQAAGRPSKEESELVRKKRVESMHQSWSTAIFKMRRYLKQLHADSVPLSQRNLVLFYMGNFNGGKDSLDVPLNNVKLFISSILQHSSAATQKAFYLLAVCNGPQNAFIKFVPSFLPNVATIIWPNIASEKETPLRTALMIGEELISNFSAIIVTSDRVRGPMTGRTDGEWIQMFRSLLDHNNVGIVGSTINCDLVAHVQPHMYAYRPELLPAAVRQYIKKTKNQDNSVSSLLRAFADGMSNAAVRSGYKISSILTHARLQKAFFDGTCIQGVGSEDKPTGNPTGWCTIAPEEIVFYKWGGVPLRTYGGICEKMIDRMQDYMIHLAHTDHIIVNNPLMHLVLPETLVGGLMYDLRKMYDVEVWKDKVKLLAPQQMDILSHAVDLKIREWLTPKEVHEPTAPNSQVCFLVLTARKHDHEETIRRQTLYLKVTLEDFIKSLQRQTNLNWKAFFINIDYDPAFQARLHNILNTIRDGRLIYHTWSPMPPILGIHEKYRLFDKILEDLVMKHSECRYFSFTSADNFYGSEVVERVLASRVRSAADATTTWISDQAVNEFKVEQGHRALRSNLLSFLGNWGSSKTIDSSSSSNITQSAATTASATAAVAASSTTTTTNLMNQDSIQLKESKVINKPSKSSLMNKYQSKSSGNNIIQQTDKSEKRWNTRHSDSKSIMKSKVTSSRAIKKNTQKTKENKIKKLQQMNISTNTAATAAAQHVNLQDVIDESNSLLLADTTIDDIPDLILNPLDTKYTAEYEYQKREQLRKIDQRYERCIGIEAMTSLQLLPYTIQPNPINGRIDFSAIFINRLKLLSDPISFINITIPLKIPSNCISCQDGYLLEYFIKNHQWHYIRLPIAGVKSIVFHGPAPGLCISSGNVWFDFPSTNKVGCLSQKTVDRIRIRDMTDRPNFDWKFFSSFNRVCLRLTAMGYAAKDDLIFS